ncbi:hypothetical protein C8Q75DRAFT_759177 [Abortiporus biennis]|nr:hypothetical protein C8Q75DRAFT_759177 [Abortiporus biennis]
MTSTPANHDPALTQTQPPAAQTPAPVGSQSAQGAPAEQGPLLVGLQTEQVMALLKNLPGFSRDLKDNAAAAETLSNLSQSGFQPHPLGQGLPLHTQFQAQLMSEPGPSSHPRGPPTLGQFSASPTSALRQGAEDEGQSMEMEDPASQGGEGSPSPDDKPSSKPAGRRGGRSATMTNDEWARQRKDNHKEVERRRRGNINEGINELGRIVPNGSGEKAKGAILARAVQYIHHLKENEARNIEKWTLEKLLMDQAMGDLQAQLEEMRRLWEEERVARQRADAELDALRGLQNGQPPSNPTSADKESTGKRSRAQSDAAEENAVPGQLEEGDERSKRPRVD